MGKIIGRGIMNHCNTLVHPYVTWPDLKKIVLSGRIRHLKK